MRLLAAAISPFKHRPRLRRLWLHMVKLVLGAGLRYKLIPAERRNFLGGIHFLIRSGILGQEKWGFVRAMVIEVASICNAACSFCPYPLLEFPRKLMSEKTFDSALAEARLRRIPDIDFTPYLGEAFVDPQFLPRIRKARREMPSAYFRLITNGTLLTRFDLDELLKSGISRINVSFGAWGKEDYLALYNIDAWEKVYAGVERLLLAKERLKSDVFIGLWYRVLDAQRVKAIPENVAFLERFRHVIDEVSYTDVYHDILSISGRQPKSIKIEQQFDSSSLKKFPCANLGKLACSSTGNWFACYCGATDCYKQEQSWFYLGSTAASNSSLNRALRQKVNEWNAGRIPKNCRTCPVYVPANKPGCSIAYDTADIAPVALPENRVPIQAVA